MTPAQLQQLELLVDASSLTSVLQGLAEIAALKAEHLAGAWQDQPRRGWNAASSSICRVATRLEGLMQ